MSKTEKYIKIENLSVSDELFKFVNEELLPGTKIIQRDFWEKFDSFAHELTPENRKLIKIREKMQMDIDSWHIENPNIIKKEYQKFLIDIGYLVKPGSDFKIDTKNIDHEISKIAAPQLVVPIMNSRYALNAANARWMSLYDSLYGTDIIQSDESASERYDPERGEEVIKFTKKFLDKHFTLKKKSWSQVSKIIIEKKNLVLNLINDNTTIKDNNKFIGYRGKKDKPTAIILKNNNLYVEIIINPEAFSAKSDPAGISDIILESAVTTICDHEDSVAGVDAHDKVLGYRNWLGLMKGDLKAEFDKNGKKLIRKLNPDRKFILKSGELSYLHGRSLLLNRNVGHLMTNPSILLSDGSEIPEGIMDAFIISVACLHDLKIRKNSRNGSIYIVKPKMHGPKEAKFTDLIFSKVETAIGLKKNTIKCGIMDEERRTSVNLKECIRALKSRVFFINTGFLDRTGDEMHTSMEAGPMIKKGDMKTSSWINAYENNNVDIGLACGFSGLAQIGKGMWAMPDKMSDMMKQKISHLEAGANCAWVPSPTAAALHALHYHDIDVFKKQHELKKRKKTQVSELLNIPIIKNPNWSVEDINKEISNSAQTILGYVVRWIDQGIGCSKVPDINNIGLMEDRATCRISSQLIANWLHHNLVTNDEVVSAMKKMALVVDEQNAIDPLYQPMGPSYSGLAFKAACNLAIKGRIQPSGYTEPILHQTRLKYKS